MIFPCPKRFGLFKLVRYKAVLPKKYHTQRLSKVSRYYILVPVFLEYEPKSFTKVKMNEDGRGGG